MNRLACSLLFTAAVLALTCSRVPEPVPPTPASQAVSAAPHVCPSGRETPELYLGPRFASLSAVPRGDTVVALDGQVRLPERVLWNDQEHTAAGRARAVGSSEDGNARRLVRAGFHGEAALYAAPEDLPGVQDLWLLIDGQCALQPYRQIVCTREAYAGINVEVVNNRTGEPPGRGATLVVRDGEYTDTATLTEPLSVRAGGPGHVHLSAAFERPGTYELDVRSPGYRPWRVGGVVVPPGRCHVQPVNLRVYLEPAR